MRRFTYVLLSSLLMSALILSCEKEEDLTPAEMLEGKWIIESTELLATVSDGDGSYLIFNPCNTLCDGVDYRASDASSGTFTYVLADDALSIAIEDTTNVGGGYDGTWDILELTEEDFRIVGNTIFGSLKIEMKKEE